MGVGALARRSVAPRKCSCASLVSCLYTDATPPQILCNDAKAKRQTALLARVPPVKRRGRSSRNRYFTGVSGVFSYVMDLLPPGTLERFVHKIKEFQADNDGALAIMKKA